MTVTEHQAGEKEEDRDTARLVASAQQGDRDAFTALYTRYFDRAYAYLRVLLRDSHEAEDATQQVFIKVYEALPRFEHRAEPFRAWLFTIARNHALTLLEKRGRSEVMEPEAVAGRIADGDPVEDEDLLFPGWITDRDLMLFVERLPLIQRQVLVLRYVVDLRYAEIGRILGRSAEDVRAIQSRAVAFLRVRLAAVGRGHGRERRRSTMKSRIPHAYVLRSRRFALHR